MRRVLGVALVATMAVVAAPAAANAKSKPKPPKVVVLAAAQATPALLALEDMPTGWAGAPAAPPAQASTTDGICNGPDGLARAQSAGVLVNVASSFSQDPTYGPIITENVYAFPSTAAAKSFTDATSAVVSTCTNGWQTTSPNVPGLTAQWTVTPLSFPKLGSQTFAFRQAGTTSNNGQASGTTGTIDSVYLRQDNNVLVIGRSAASSLAASPTTDVGQLQTFSQKALSKLGVALAAAKKAAATATTTTKAKKK